MDLGYTRHDSSVIHEFLRFTSTRIIGFSSGFTSYHTCDLLDYCSLSRLLLPALESLLLKAIISALRLALISLRVSNITSLLCSRLYQSILCLHPAHSPHLSTSCLLALHWVIYYPLFKVLFKKSGQDSNLLSPSPLDGVYSIERNRTFQPNFRSSYISIIAYAIFGVKCKPFVLSDLSY